MNKIKKIRIGLLATFSAILLTLTIVLSGSTVFANPDDDVAVFEIKQGQSVIGTSVFNRDIPNSWTYNNMMFSFSDTDDGTEDYWHWRRSYNEHTDDAWSHSSGHSYSVNKLVTSGYDVKLTFRNKNTKEFITESLVFDIAEIEGIYVSIYTPYYSDSNVVVDYDGNTIEYPLTLNTEVVITYSPRMDNIRPAISGEENFVTNVDQPKTVAYFQSYLTAIDETDGNITNKIYIDTDNYTTNKNIVGRHKIIFGVSDLAGNVSTLEVFVNVVDITKPTITGNTSKATISYTQTWNISSFKSTLVATDNYDTLTNADIVIKSDNYTSNKTNLGTHTVIFEVSDESGNKGTFTKQIEVIDDVAPVWSGPSSLTKPATTVLTVSNIISQLTATDAKEGNVSNSIIVVTDNYTGNGHKVGSYTITFEAQDSKGNKSTHTVTVRVDDSIAPIFYIQDGISILLASGVELTHQQIIDILAASGQVTHQGTTTYSFPIDNYTGNEKEPGVYTMALNARSTTGNEYTHEFAITVMEADDEGIVIGEVGNWIQNNIIWVLLGIGGASLVIYLVISKPKRKRR